MATARVRAFRLGATAIGCVGLAFAVAAAEAAPPQTGKWKGDWFTSAGKRYGNDPVRFSVAKKGSKRVVKGFRSTSLPIYCPGGSFGAQFTEIKLPTTPIKRGKIRKTYPIVIKGTKYGEMEIDGTISARKAKGTLRYQDPACFSTTSWRAKRR